MKSSAVTLTYRDEQDGETYLVNLIDSPGHVDFSSEVSTAVRLCDGAIVVVDVVEGVQPQTKVVLAQAWREGIAPVLVLNKVDRLTIELKLDPLAAYLHLRSVLEQVNAVIGELFAADVMEAGAVGRRKYDDDEEEDEGEEGVFDDWATGLEDADDSDLYFAPESGNVLFASAYDGWAFDLDTFARIYSQKLGFSRKALRRTLWGDFYINSKTKRIMRGAHAKGKKPLFVQLVLQNVWSVYEAAALRGDKDKLQKIAESLQIKVTARDLRSTDPKVQVGAVLSQWLPLAPSLLAMVCRRLPAPDQLVSSRAEKLMCSSARRFETLPEETRALKSAFLACSSAEEAPVIVFVSKMCPVQKKSLPKNKPKPLTAEELAERREKAKQRLAGKEEGGETLTEEDLAKLKLEADERRKKEEEEGNETTFIAFARVFSGVLKPGQTLYVLGPKYDPVETLENIKGGQPIVDETATVRDNPSNKHILRAKVGEVYLLAGREMHELERGAPAGSVVGIGGLEDYILKSATVSSDPACPAFAEVTASAAPILRVAVEPAKPSQMQQLVRGLRLLNQADANVEVALTDRGEHVLATAGEVHLERCLRDLKESYAGIEVNASSPIVPFRETVVHPPKTDMVNEELGEDNKIIGKEEDDDAVGSDDASVKVQTANKKITVTIRAAPLCEEATKLLAERADFFRAWDRSTQEDTVSESILTAREEIKSKLVNALKEDSDLCQAVDRVWCVGPRKCGPNLLINNIEGYSRTSFWEKKVVGGDGSNSVAADFDSSIVSGFQLATLAGPLCEEPLMGVAFIVDNFEMSNDNGGDEDGDSARYGPLSGQVVSAVKEGCRRAFQARPQRLMAAMYSCDVQVKAEALGKLYASLGRRHGRVVGEEMVEGSSTFTVTAHLPVVESFQFAQEVRRQTSGLAMPQLVFSHWETVDVDPFWEPRTEEEVAHFGDKADSENQARRYMNELRKRKGLAIDEKIVEFAEKQRTLNKKK